MNILIGGDLVPTKSNFDLFKKGDIEALIGQDLNQILKSSDYRIFNLEVPLTDISTPLVKCGPNLIAPTSTIKGIKALRTDLLTLANNHILDQKKEGLKSTIDLLKKNKIAYVGAGENLTNAMEPYIIEKDGLKIGVYACAEHEFTIADENNYGANPFEPLDSLDHIENLKKVCDRILVLFHGGTEHYKYPTPYLQKACRKMVEKGADIVVCQHSHCIGCYEYYMGAAIIYGQGNFLFDRYINECWQTSLIVSWVVTKDISTIEFIPLKKQNEKVRLANGSEYIDILKTFEERSESIHKAGFLDTEFKKWSSSLRDRYFNVYLNGNIFVRVISKISGRNLWRVTTTKNSLRRMLNYLECEAHREAFICAIKEIALKNK